MIIAVPDRTEKVITGNTKVKDSGCQKYRQKIVRTEAKVAILLSLNMDFTDEYTLRVIKG